MSDAPDDPTKTLSRRTDDTLVRAYRDGNEAAAASLHERYARRLRAMARRYCNPAFAARFDADDVVQSTFRTFFEGVRDQRYDVPAGGDIWNLLTVLALSKVRKQVGFHTAGPRDVRQTATVADFDAAGVCDHDEAAAAFLKIVLDELMAGLPESNREVIRLRLEGFEVAEIAAKIGRSRRTVERTLQDFRARLTADE